MELKSNDADNFPSVCHPDYNDSIALWNYLDDLYYGADRWLKLTDKGFQPTEKTNLYLPRHAAEAFDNWVSRINQSCYDDLFGKALRQFVDLIFKNDVIFSDDSEGNSVFIDHYNNLDNHGVLGDVLLRNIALSSMRLGHSFVFIDLPVVDVNNYQEFRDLSPRPYWSLIPAQKLINWRTAFINNELVFTLAVIKEEIYINSGDYGYEKVEQYRVYKPGIYEIWRKNDKEITLEFSGNFDSGYEFVPIIPVFGGYRFDDCVSIPPLRGLADKNRILYQLTSDHNRKVSLCCQPTPVLQDSLMADEPLEIGPNSFIRLRDPNGKFSWEEPLALSLEQSRKDLDDLKASISYDAATYITTPSDRQTAAATQLLTSPLEANLLSFVTSFSDGINRAIAIHNKMIGCDCTTTISFDTKLLASDAAPKKEQIAIAIQGLFTNDIIGRKTALKALNKLGLFDNDFDLSQELNTDDRYIKP